MTQTEDRTFSKFIRERDGYECQRCHLGYDVNSPWLQCAHMFSRGKFPTRFDPENAVALCWICHGYLDQHPNEKRMFFRLRLGDEAFEALELRSNGTKIVSPTRSEEL
jgi:hypothetical protein